MNEIAPDENVVAQLQKLTGMAPKSENRPSWSFDLEGAILPGRVADGSAEFFTDEQKNGTVKLEFIYLSASEELEAIGDAAKACASVGINMTLAQTVPMEYRARRALWKIDGKPLEYGALARAWNALGEIGRDIITSMYAHAVGLASESNVKARANALASFRPSV